MILIGLVLTLTAAAGCRPASRPLRVAGSTSVQPVAEVLAEAFTKATGERVSVQGGGSTAGVQAVVSGVADMGAISRRLTAGEAAQGLVANVIGYDVLTVVVHPTNHVAGLTLDQLRKIFAGTHRDWRDVGGRPGSIHVVSREAGSGSREAFRTLVGPVSPRAIVQNSSGAIRVAVMDDPQAIGYVSLGAARTGGVKMLPVDGRPPGNPAYALTRSLGLVTAGPPTGAAVAFIRFARSSAGQRLIIAEGLVPVAHEPPTR